MGGGPAGAGGYDFQALVTAYVGVHILAARRLDWVRDGDLNSVPMAVASETGGPGDDLRIEFVGPPLETQVKRGLNATKLHEVIEGFAEHLATNATDHLLLVVDLSADKTVKEHFRKDLSRLADGRVDGLKPITSRVISALEMRGIADPPRLLARVHLMPLDMGAAGGAHEGTALERLVAVVGEADHRRAWDLLVRDAVRLLKERGRWDRARLIGLLRSEGIRIEGQPTATPPALSMNAPKLHDGIVGAGDGQDDWNRRIDDAMKLMRSHRSKAALALLRQIETDAGGQHLPPRIRYRLATNMGGCHMDMGQYAEAEPLLRRALDYEDQDMTARAGLAQLKFMGGDLAAALAMANDVLRRSPDCVSAWLTVIQASKTQTPAEAIPETVRDQVEILAARGIAAHSAGDREASSALFRRALQKERNPQVLVLLAQALNEQDEYDDAERYASEAISLLEPSDREPLLSEALSLRGVIRANSGRLTLAKEDFDRAVALPNPTVGTYIAAAQNYLALDQPADALRLLGKVVSDDEDQCRLLGLRARAYAQAGNTDEVSRHVRLLLDHPDCAAHKEGLLLGAEAALLVDLVDVAAAVVRRNTADDDLRTWWVRARLARRRGENDEMRAAYATAIELASVARRQVLQAELGSALASLGDVEAAISVFEEARAADGPDSIRREYARALYRGRQIARLLVLLGPGHPNTKPSWALELEVRIAFDRRDWRTAIVVLRHLRSHAPDDASLKINLARALLQEGEQDEAVGLLLGLGGAAEPEELMGAAQLLGGLRPVEALDLAYRAVQKRPDDPQLRLVYVQVFTTVSKQHPALKVAEVVANTSVQLRSKVRDETREYFLVPDGPADIRRGEILVGEERGQKLIGKRIGDTITFRVGALDEDVLEIVAIRTAPVRLFQETLTNFRLWFPDDTSLQSFPTGTGRLDEFVPMVADLQGRASYVEHVLDHYRTNLVPLGFLAKMLDGSFRDVYSYITRTPTERLLVERGDAESAMAALNTAKASTPVVLAASALLTWHRLGNLDLLAQLFGRLHVPQSLVDELKDEHQRLSRHANVGAGSIAWHNDRLLLQENDQARTGRELDEIQTLLAWLSEHCDRHPRSIAGLTEQAKHLRDGIGASSQDTLTLALELQGVLFADDYGLRALASGEHGLKGFSTFAALKVAAEKGFITDIELARTAERLILLNHDFVPMWPDMLWQAIEDRSFQIDADVLRLTDRLRGERTDTGAAVRVGVSLLRRLALSPVGNSPQISMLSDMVFDSLFRDRGVPVLRLVRGEIRRQALLVPNVEDALLGQLNAFVVTKVAGGSV